MLKLYDNKFLFCAIYELLQYCVNMSMFESDSDISVASVTSPVYRSTFVPDAVSQETEPYEQDEIATTPENPNTFVLSTPLPRHNSYAPDHLLNLFSQTYPYNFHQREPIPEVDIPTSSRLRISDSISPLSPSLPYPPGFTPPAHINETGESARMEIPSTFTPSVVVTRLEHHEDQIDSLLQMIDYSSFDHSDTTHNTLHNLIADRIELQQGLAQIRSDISETRSFAISLRREGQDRTWEAQLARRRADTLENIVGDMKMQHHTEMQELRFQIFEMGEHVNIPNH